MAKKVIHFKKDCISCGACEAISPEFWKLEESGIAQLIGATEVGDHWELIIEKESSIEANKEAADVCPVNIIHVKDIKDDE
ncbi:ferredoxin [Candidatus Woesearchaeota archaeon CG10_big_fil_rev_8_21_14_0_10_32_24]|nr:MAG: ferredoxin [Candidatus Woesearchaeota archaeon CG10_big_fil_rev_8_21_14_0_10_32_24]